MTSIGKMNEKVHLLLTELDLQGHVEFYMFDFVAADVKADVLEMFWRAFPEARRCIAFLHLVRHGGWLELSRRHSNLWTIFPVLGIGLQCVSNMFLSP